MAKTNPRDHSLFLKAFRAYLQFVNSGLYFKKEHVLGLENVPVNGTPTIIVSNHQNCLNDPLCVCLQLTDRRMNFLARATVFNIPIFNKALRAMGLLPAYRMGYEGLAHVRRNSETFEDAGNALMDGENTLTVIAKDTLSKKYPYGKQCKRRGGMWYTPVSGIWQSVWIESIPK